MESRRAQASRRLGCLTIERQLQLVEDSHELVSPLFVIMMFIGRGGVMWDLDRKQKI